MPDSESAKQHLDTWQILSQWREQYRQRRREFEASQSGEQCCPENNNLILSTVLKPSKSFELGIKIVFKN